ncbi:IQ calmodulin-binding motif protein [Aspergillus nomiae NRRL 13137]|uniref:IQ calmodulin-binding motif protein n=1 Tax=Aspergillus nomiae NRRL (strain ATCC 15546 / NRRL 13137 / CBS 260.88 / M93) TaxID=1509407 RepID=A0A0L1IZ40_ASPN3|nr:IQ calmodulin-binding motif protein [Aspergillus nomiae NRRL 13137]KNG84821.1 IQ calmodulin-binding motif protein [Aspergillus nomiae NRRL 13137]
MERPPRNDVTDKEQWAARVIQRTYRGYRTRRELQGCGISATTRWVEAVKEAEWRVLHRPSAPEATVENDSSAHARRNWQRAVSVAKRAGGDDDLDRESASPTRNETWQSSGKPAAPAQLDLPPGTTAKMMDLQYFLELVDLKHRHGSNLRVYHSHWKNSTTAQNFFFWLDYGEGKDLDLPQCPRDKLERQQVRYLSREERMNYLVTVDEAGLFRWAKNNERVWTDNRRFKDSLKGVVHIDEDAPQFQGNTEAGDPDAFWTSSSSSVSSLSSSDYDSDSDTCASRTKETYVNEDYKAVKKLKKVVHVSPSTVLSSITGKSLKKEDMWIFVADTSLRLYIGIKQSGAFQHSSFLRGARIAAAGLIKVRDGQLRSLAPLSGHYRPPAANFRAFIHSLQERGVDMSHVSISKSYAVLAGIEGYTRTKHKVRALHEKVDDMKQKVLQAHHNGEKGQTPACPQNEGDSSPKPLVDDKQSKIEKANLELPLRTRSRIEAK